MGKRQDTVTVYGLRIALSADSETGLNELRSVLPPGAQSCDDRAADISYGMGALNSNESVVYVDGKILCCSRDDRAVLRTVHRHVQLYVAEHAPGRVFIHAGVVGWKGQAVVIPGRSHAGKSTLVAELLRAGATYYSDEFAVVDSLGRIHPYPQPIGLRDKNGESREVDPARFSAGVGRKPLIARLVLVTRHRDGARWRPRRVSRGEGMLALLANTVSARRDPNRALRSLNRMLAGADVLRGLRGEAEATAGQLICSGYLPA